MEEKQVLTTARITGVWYLLLGISGMVGFLWLHPQLFVNNDPSKTLNNLTEQETLAHLRLVLEFTIVVSQALAAVWFYKLFRDIDHFSSWTLAIWGMMNSCAIMISAIALSVAVKVSGLDQLLHDDKVILIQLMMLISNNSWGVGSLFFGLWLIPMGYIVVSTKRMPVWLGRILILGGIGYVLNTYIKYMGVNESWLDMLVIPATIGEFWMIGYLLIFGIRTAK